MHKSTQTGVTVLHVRMLHNHIRCIVFLHRMGDKGELLVKTEVMCQGYYNNDTQTATTFTDGWYVLFV